MVEVWNPIQLLTFTPGCVVCLAIAYPLKIAISCVLRIRSLASTGIFSIDRDRIMAAAATPPGWNASGKQIIDPVKFLESILQPIIDRTAREDTLTPTYEDAESTYTGGLIIEFPESLYQKQMIPSLGFTRVGANGDGNCWFDSFLFCMSKSYRNLSAMNRIPVTGAFRAWCADHAKQIVTSIPSSVREYLEPESSFTQHLKANGTEIDLLEGIMVAWFFGVNCIYFATPGSYPNKPASKLYEPVCESMFQSPNCKVVCMIFSGNHFEPLIDADFTDETLNESVSTTVFSWKNPKLCKCIASAMQSCAGFDAGLMSLQPWKVTCAAAGGGKRRRRAKTHRVKRRRSTRRRHI